jgi:two-component sensor histidine kinase
MGNEEELRLTAESVDLRRRLEEAGIVEVDHEAKERLQRLLINELHHRVKNSLAVMQAIISQTLRSAESKEQAGEAIELRLQALGRVHDVLVQTSWEGAKLDVVVRACIAPFENGGVGRFVVAPNDITIGAAETLALAMTLNELCTNAVKYGALSKPEGRVEITTDVDVIGKQFRLRWEESGGPPVHAPSRRFFGMRLIEQSFVSQVQGGATVRFEPAGLVCEIVVPLPSSQRNSN